MAHAAEDELNAEVVGEDASFELPAFYPIEFLDGFANKGNDDFIMVTGQASFRCRVDLNFSIQYFSAIANNHEINPSHEATISYLFPSELFAGRPFGFNIALNSGCAQETGPK
ncbi:translocon-associated protein subunit alpha [Culex quinquefasciatus]|uniref:Translocon-associated protein subunit alpha n=1 Tax=Culex quinquefasciatus TaxID=7176 RepID=B0X0K8_CULQU|nr:translocon-associated protein subunit alpha [Culex quinquefasciatus]|eukprot:XP_001863180.1 translocon-associated protein subunit alpha [Culex quinquefasciatus]